ncbi:MAG: inositol monophosphatase family protein [Thermoplasmata archaeon]|nr:inositol monophosphatase family protein [Thermoplasmata archaeon]
MITMEDLSAIADAVQEAVEKIPSSEERGKKVCMGADGTYSSQVDKVAENAALMYIERNHLPLNVLSEEIGYVDNGGDEVLVMDPIDGTSNAIAGLPYYTVSLAVGKSHLSDIRLGYLRNLATGDVICAEKGKGAFKNGRPIHVRKAVPDDLFLMIYEGNGAHPDAFTVAKFVRSSRSLGCASLEMEIVAEGEADGFFMKAEKYTRSVRIVDIAASTIILREAGGEVYDLDNNVLEMPFDLEHRSNFLAVGDDRVYDIIARHRIHRAEHRYGVYANAQIGNIIKPAGEVVEFLRESGVDFCVDTGIAEALGVPGIPLSRMNADIVIVVGGDGTILRALQSTDAVIVGVNGGSVGFLAEIENNAIREGLERLLAEDYIVETRFKLACFYNGEYLKDSVNEAVVHTDTVAKIRHFRVYVDDVLASELRSDGILVSTPTGSTCYAMSLGAPYMDPKVNALMVVPMAAFKFSSRPFVVPATSKVTVENVLDKGCLIVLDGQDEIYMEGHARVEFMMSERKARFIRFNTDFYSRVRDKLVNTL